MAFKPDAEGGWDPQYERDSSEAHGEPTKMEAGGEVAIPEVVTALLPTVIEKFAAAGVDTSEIESAQKNRDRVALASAVRKALKGVDVGEVDAGRFEEAVDASRLLN